MTVWCTLPTKYLYTNLLDNFLWRKKKKKKEIKWPCSVKNTCAIGTKMLKAVPSKPTLGTFLWCSQIKCSHRALTYSLGQTVSQCLQQSTSVLPTFSNKTFSWCAVVCAVSCSVTWHSHAVQLLCQHSVMWHSHAVQLLCQRSVTWQSHAVQSVVV